MIVTDLDLVRAIEERSFNAWPALETQLLDGWVVRLANGYTKRANSLNAWMPRAPIDAVIGRAGAIYRGRSQPLIARLSPLAGPDADVTLAALGFSRFDDSIVMIAEHVRSSTAVLPPGRTLVLDDRPSADWTAGFSAANGVAADRRLIHDRMLACIQPPVVFATLRESAGPLAYGLAVAERGWVGLFDIVTLPAARRQGAALDLVGGLLGWAAANGAPNAYLQVVATNTPARALYERLGFRDAYRYHYRIAP